MINNMDLIREKLAYHHTATDDEIIKTVLKNAREDPDYLAACEGLRYYRGMQDILQKDFRETVVYEEDENSPAGIKRGGVKIINENNSNHHNVHNFHALMVDQKVAYILGKPLSVSVEGANDGAGGADESLKAFEDAVTAVTSDEALWTCSLTSRQMRQIVSSDGCMSITRQPASFVLSLFRQRNVLPAAT